MTEDLTTSTDFAALEIVRLRSEIDRNNAERDSYRATQKAFWKPYFLAFAAALVIVGTFLGFLADLYQIATTDRDSVKRANEKLIAENASLTGQLKSLSQADQAARAMSKQLDVAAAAAAESERRIARMRALLAEAGPQFQAKAEEAANTNAPPSITEESLKNAVVVVWWGQRDSDAFAVSLNPPSRETGNESFAEGVQLGKAQTDLGLKGGGEWVARWQFTSGKLKLTETFPRAMNRGIRAEIDLTRGKVNGRWPATRTRGAASEAGSAEIVFPTPTR